MAIDLLSARHWALSLMDGQLGPGMKAVDATMGNGHDTLYLAERVGETGHVWAFDVQPSALAQTRARLDEAGLSGRCSLILDDHQHMAAHVPERVDAVMFNLGWLPGGDKRVTTARSSTLAALNAAARLLKLRGLITVCAYPGHGEGEAEYGCVLDWAHGLDGRTYQTRLTAYLNQPPNSPAMICIQRIKQE